MARGFDIWLAMSLMLSAVGLLTLSYALPRADPPLARISDIDSMSLEKRVRFAGEAVRVHSFKGGSAAVTVTSNGSELEVYVPYNLAKSSNISSILHRRLLVEGTVQYYGGRLEVIAESLEDAP